MYDKLIVYLYVADSNEAFVFGKDSESTYGELVNSIFTTLPSDYYSNINRRRMLDMLETVDLNGLRSIKFIKLFANDNQKYIQFAPVFSSTLKTLNEELEQHYNWFQQEVWKELFGDGSEYIHLNED